MEQFEENNYQDYTSQFALQNADAADAANRYESPRNSNGLAIASLVLGISSLVTCCCCLLGLILGIIGIVLACVGKKGRDWDGLLIAGLVCSILGTVSSLAGLIKMLIPFSLSLPFWGVL